MSNAMFFVLGDPHAREMLLSFPAACDTCCSLPAATLCLCCTSATGGVMLSQGKAALLHLACAAPQAGLAWVEEFKLPLSLCVRCELALLGYPWLG